jgi:fructokinase
MRVICIGEILWDVVDGSEFLGGAPFNLCAHLAQLGHHSIFISAVGRDRRGSQALEKSTALGIDTRFIATTERAPTGVSEVVLDGNGKAAHNLLRPAAYDFVTLDLEHRKLLSQERPDWICYGTLAQMEVGPRSLTRHLFGDNTGAKRFYDVNLRPRCWTPELVEDLFHQANAVKLNDEEANAMAGLFDWPSGSLPEFSELAARRFGLELLCVTRGALGCSLWREGEFVESQGFHVEVADTIGSGDAFSAALLHGLSEKWALRDVAEFANRVGALVASRSGATPTWSKQEALQLLRAAAS